MMEKTGTSDSGFDGSYKLFAQDSTDDRFFSDTEDDLQVSVSVPRPELKHYKLTSMCLGLLAVLLLLVDVSLSIYYSQVRDRYLRLNDVSYIRKELSQLQDDYMITMQSRDEAKTMLARQVNERDMIRWDLEHQKRRTRDYNDQILKIQGANAAIRAKLPLIEDGCKHCLPGWMLLNTMCYFLPLSDSVSRRSWQDARTQCRRQGADLAIVDSREKQLSLSKLINGNEDGSRPMHQSGFGSRTIRQSGFGSSGFGSRNKSGSGSSGFGSSGFGSSGFGSRPKSGSGSSSGSSGFGSSSGSSGFGSSSGSSSGSRGFGSSGFGSSSGSSSGSRGFGSSSGSRGFGSSGFGSSGFGSRNKSGSGSSGFGSSGFGSSSGSRGFGSSSLGSSGFGSRKFGLSTFGSRKYQGGFWIGLRDDEEEGHWKWRDGTSLVEAYWNEGEPNDDTNEDCAAVYPRDNPFHSWNDAPCGHPLKWICEMLPRSRS